MLHRLSIKNLMREGGMTVTKPGTDANSNRDINRREL
jgi:hypothetical protein